MEIGGYFELERNESEIYHKGALQINSGRNCLRLLIREKKIKRIFLPYFVCGAVIEACRKERCHIIFYHINCKFHIAELPECFKKNKDYLFIINYCGLLSEEVILSYKEKYRNIILDNTQAFFVKPILEVDTIYSCRKFFGVPDGGYLYLHKVIESKLEYDNSYDRLQHIVGRFEIGAEPFFDKYRENETIIDDLDVKYMSRLTDNMLRGIDYFKCLERRRENYSFLYKKLQQRNKLDLPEVLIGAFAYPFYVNNGTYIRKRLIENKIFVPQYWKEVLENVSRDDWEYELVNNIIWLPCDQRYTIEQMKCIVNKIGEICGDE